MEAERAVLSSASTTLVELADRIEGVADALDERNEEAIAADLFEVERTLRIAVRRLDHVLERLALTRPDRHRNWPRVHCPKTRPAPRRAPAGRHWAADPRRVARYQVAGTW